MIGVTTVSEWFHDPSIIPIIFISHKQLIIKLRYNYVHKSSFDVSLYKCLICSNYYLISNSKFDILWSILIKYERIYMITIKSNPM